MAMQIKYEINYIEDIISDVYNKEALRFYLKYINDDDLAVIRNYKSSNETSLITMANAAELIGNSKYLDMVLSMYEGTREEVSSISLLAKAIKKYNINEETLKLLTEHIYDCELLALVCQDLDQYNYDEIKVMLSVKDANADKIRVIKKAFKEGISIEYIKMFVDCF